MHKRIFVPVDGNPTSVPGLNEAVELPRLTGACLMPAHPVDALVFLTGRRIGANTMNDVLPPQWHVQRWKALMRITLAGYWTVAVLGIVTYYYWYAA